MIIRLEEEEESHKSRDW